MSKRSRKKKQRYSSGLADHRRYKKDLSPPMAQISNLKTVAWIPDVLPEMLLIDAAVHQLTWEFAPSALHRAIDSLDLFIDDNTKDVITGTISSMSLISEENRENALESLIESGEYETILPESLRHGIALYPNCPARWLISKWEKEHRIDWEIGISYLKGAVRRLWDSKSVYSTRCRMLPVARLAKNGKLMFSSEIESIKLFPKYPIHLNEADQMLVESSTRSMFNASWGMFDNEHSDKWSIHFWRHNYQISACEQDNEQPYGSFVDDEELNTIVSEIAQALQRLRSVAQRAINQAQLDIYNLDRDEVIFGILSRQHRLFNVIAKNPPLWTADMGSLFHRVMVDVFITLKWLIQQNDQSLFRKFKEYSLGKQKLLKLHVQDLVDEGREELEGYEEYLAESINEEIWEEFLSIDLGGHFSGKDVRKMAHEVGVRDLYNLVYSPSSSELHSEWMSLKRFNLVRCGNPLHRFHRLPRFSSASIVSPRSIIFAGQMLFDTFKLYLDVYNMSDMENEAEFFLIEIEEAFQELEKTGNDS